jgi:hypothetical protein
MNKLHFGSRILPIGVEIFGHWLPFLLPDIDSPCSTMSVSMLATWAAMWPHGICWTGLLYLVANAKGFILPLSYRQTSGTPQKINWKLNCFDYRCLSPLRKYTSEVLLSMNCDHNWESFVRLALCSCNNCGYFMLLLQQIMTKICFKGLGTSTNQLVCLLVDCIEHWNR